jgi:hypothetical protein
MATKSEQQKIALEKYNFKLLLQILSCFIFVLSCALISLGVINATFIPLDENGNSTSLVTNAAKENCNRYSGVYLGLPGLFIGPVGLLLIGLLIPKQWALRLAIAHLALCVLGFIFNTVLADRQVSTCLYAQSLHLKEYYEKEDSRKLNYIINNAWLSKRAEYEFPERQLPLATYVIIGAKSFILVTAVLQIAAYLLSAIILGAGLGFAARKKGKPNAQPHEVEAVLDIPHHGRHAPKE